MKLIDLTHIIDPAKAQRKFSVETIGAETVNPNVVRLQKQWYIMSEIQMVSHIGTHMEAPYHIFPEGQDLADIPVEALCGETLLLDFSDIQKKEEITKERVMEEAEKAGGIWKGDIVLCNLGYADRYGQEAYGESPYFSHEAICWLADQGIKMMGVDAGGVEIPQSEQHVNHKALFERNITLVENAANLDRLPKARFYVTAFPYPVRGVEAFPVRLVAFVEGDRE
ncbi:MAG: cyclase family protein [Hungatella sp.]|nr:cyclase family protein [Hungatella sp.]